MSKKIRAVSIAALLGVVCGLIVVLFLFGYFSGSSRKVPVLVVSGEKQSFENSSDRYERKLSVVRLPNSLKVTLGDVRDLEQLVRFKNEKRDLYSIDNLAPGSFWSEDIVIGFADGGPDGSVIYRCEGKTRAGMAYHFYSTFANCWGPKKNGVKADFTLIRANPSPLHMAVYSCLTSQKNRYLSLNPSCEAEGDNPQEMLGYVRAATVLTSEQ